MALGLGLELGKYDKLKLSLHLWNMTVQSTYFFYWNCMVNFMDMFQLVWQTIVVSDCGRSSDSWIAICPISPGRVSWQVPAPCWIQIIASVRGGIQRLMNMYIYLPGAWQKFRSTAMINNFSQMCVYLIILQLRIMNNKLIEAIELPVLS